MNVVATVRVSPFYFTEEIYIYVNTCSNEDNEIFHVYITLVLLGEKMEFFTLMDGVRAMVFNATFNNISVI